MTTMGVAAPGGAPTSTLAAHRWRQLRFCLLAVAMGLVAGLALVGTSPASLSELKGAIVSGRVHEVRVVGALPTGANGYARVVLYWRDGNHDRYTDVVEASDVAALPTAQLPETEHVVGSVAESLRALDGSARIVADDHSASGASIGSWQVPGWFSLTALALWAGTVLLIANGARPWWATRWAWLWLVISPLAVVAVPLFLVVSGPPPGVPDTTLPGRRLTGGWALLLAGAVGSLVGPSISLGL